MKAKILIVEDEAVLYERLRRNLTKENYVVFDYTPSVDEALSRINITKPDLVLLDIHLEGNKTGLDLGKKLNEYYKIPFIYVTQYSDDQTFYEGLHTNHEDFVVKTKPHLDTKELIRKIQTVLNRNSTKTHDFTENGLMVLADYLDEIKNLPDNAIGRIPIEYSQIAYFSTASFMNKNNMTETLRPNYIWLYTYKTVKDKIVKERYFLKSSLSELSKKLPYNFVRVNDSYIINLNSDVLKGRINGSSLQVLDQKLTVSPTYKKNVEERISFFYK